VTGPARVIMPQDLEPKVAVLSTLYPNAVQPNFGIFVENSVRHVAASGIGTKVIAPNGVPIWPIRLHPTYRPLAKLPRAETWRDLDVRRPRFPVVPNIGWRFNPRMIADAARPILRSFQRLGFEFNVIDAEFFTPCGIAAVRLAKEFDIAVTIKARGADIHHWGRNPKVRAWMINAAERADGLMAVAKSLRDDMIELGMPGDKIEVHYTGLDLDLFQPMDREKAHKRWDIAGPTVVSVGGLIPRKRHELLIETLKLMPDIRAVIAGEGPERAKLEACVKEFGVSDRVRLLGRVKYDELPSLYAAADVSFLGSRSEGLANVCVESMACGIPVIATNVDGASEAIDQPAAGLLLDSATPDAAKAAIETVLENPPDRAETRAAAERFSWARHVAAKRDHYERIIRAHREKA